MIATYAEYVWSCYIITAIVVVLILWTGHRSHRKELQALQRRHRMHGGDAAATHSEVKP